MGLFGGERLVIVEEVERLNREWGDDGRVLDPTLGHGAADSGAGGGP